MENENKSSSNVYTMPCKPGSIFVNFGEGCLNDCRFCVKRFGNFFGYSLDSHFDNQTVKNIVKGLERISKLNPNPNEVVICGIGEPFLHYDELIEVSRTSKQIFGDKVPIRADTSGLWWQGRRDLSFLEHIDSLSISLNAESEEKYNAICQPKIFGAYIILRDFLDVLKKEKLRRLKEGLSFPDVRLTLVNTADKEFMPPKKETDYKGDCPVPDISKCREIADNFGFPLVVKHLFRDVNELCWNPSEVEEITLKGISLERCIDCKYRHI